VRQSIGLGVYPCLVPLPTFLRGRRLRRSCAQIGQESRRRSRPGDGMVQDSCPTGPSASSGFPACLEAETEAEAEAEAETEEEAVSPVQQSIESYGGGR
jgi:hypothetical protein